MEKGDFEAWRYMIEAVWLHDDVVGTIVIVKVAPLAHVAVPPCAPLTVIG